MIIRNENNLTTEELKKIQNSIKELFEGEKGE